VARSSDRRSKHFALRKGLGTVGVAFAALPESAEPLMEKWFAGGLMCGDHAREPQEEQIETGGCRLAKKWAARLKPDEWRILPAPGPGRPSPDLSCSAAREVIGTHSLEEDEQGRVKPLAMA
jgi:hypothetical protein